ncbi:MAG: alpha/beta hydrolase [Mucilaginibacter polytrichastri]|nr:alpha/beta hydrolase [Mucilaginibacter polytrichastri]
MKFIPVKQASGEDLNLYYEDLGQGSPVILIHGWPLDHQMWDYQVKALVDAGFRVISYDRRGFGKSDKPATGYDYNTLTDDLKAVIDHLQLDNFALVGFSMAGGEVVRYFSKHGGRGATKAALISSIAPYMLQTDDNPEGVPQETINGIAENIQKERAGFLGDFVKQFYGVGVLSNPVSRQQLDSDITIGMQATLISTLGCAVAFSSTDLRSEMSAVTVPTLIIHGDNDQTVPIRATGEQAARMISGAEYIVYEGEPHGLFLTSKDRLNEDLVRFLKS